MGVFQVDADNIRDALKTWKPASLKTEAQYEKAIYEHLHAAFPGEVIHRQYANAKTKADLYVDFKNGGARVVTEVKCKLASRGEYHRLIGQSWEYLREWKCELVVCLCGDNDPALVKLAAEALGFLGENLNRKVHVLQLK
ncbi:MAG: hypothetical protein K8H88_05095 [Sandaracinaceae bacterium]|nr:hypothetical protein [Sandaracinaceae bacterium]